MGRGGEWVRLISIDYGRPPPQHGRHGRQGGGSPDRAVATAFHFPHAPGTASLFPATPRVRIPVPPQGSPPQVGGRARRRTRRRCHPLPAPAVSAKTSASDFFFCLFSTPDQRCACESKGLGKEAHERLRWGRGAGCRPPWAAAPPPPTAKAAGAVGVRRRHHRAAGSPPNAAATAPPGAKGR